MRRTLEKQGAHLSAWSTGAAFTTLPCATTCPTPVNLTATNTSATGTVLYLGTTTITGIYNIRYHGPNATWITLNNVTIPYQLGNLSCNTTYEWQAQKVCESATPNLNLSPWSVGAAFTTLPCPTNCLAPINLNANNISMTGAVLSWSPVSGAVSYIVRYKKAIDNTTYTTVTSNTNGIQLTGLNAATSYIWQVAAVCTPGTISLSTSLWSANAIFSTPSLVVYPNPANRFIYVECWANQASEISIELRDSFGKQVIYEKRTTVLGTNNFSFETSGIIEGLYFLSVHSNFGLVTMKIMIQH